MTAPKLPNDPLEIYQALFTYFTQGPSESSLLFLVLRLLTEVEALREALSSPDTPEAVRQSYRQAYERIAVLSHNSAGPSGGTEKIIRRFVPYKTRTDRFTPELTMLARLGATAQQLEALREDMEKVEMYT